ncbi:outer membrane beta-barrel protein [Myroides pelagicus]|uniref:outer membrane beta-barrel protein n=1 Tax=Myroides pelagicus TaxID=270914 RepID=UPI002DC04C0B|nr:outer membrane beta-barrel protein [Myroides pelagicus]MEC4113187.1 outer membrane beta-barrel protein [Myroides pelagicus]
MELNSNKNVTGFKLLCYFGLALFFNHQLKAQEKKVIEKHELSVGLGVGGTILYGSIPKNFDRKIGAEYKLDVLYDYYKKRNFSIGTGLMLSKGKVGIQASDISQSRDIQAEETRTFKYTSGLYQESWDVTTIGVPLTVQYVIEGKVDVSIRTGFVYAFAIQSQAKMEWQDVNTSLTLKDYDVALTSPGFMGLGSFGALTENREVSIGNRLSWLIEVGMKKQIAFKQHIYVGLYADIGLNNQASKIESSDALLLDYTGNENTPLQLSTLVESLGKKIKYSNASIGLKVRYMTKW